MLVDSYAEMQISELVFKAHSKKEVYDLLRNEGRIYFPIEDDNHEYKSQVIVGDQFH